LPACAAESRWKTPSTAGRSRVPAALHPDRIDQPAGQHAEAANLVKGLLEKNGIPVKLYRAAAAEQTNLLARLAGRDRSRKPLLLLNHFDVVPVDRAAWKMIRRGHVRMASSGGAARWT
jgi:acetylornithine deacetylase/succinyl-diaminopimelate desuccinylase-like protein